MPRIVKEMTWLVRSLQAQHSQKLPVQGQLGVASPLPHADLQENQADEFDLVGFLIMCKLLIYFKNVPEEYYFS